MIREPFFYPTEHRGCMTKAEDLHMYNTYQTSAPLRLAMQICVVGARLGIYTDPDSYLPTTSSKDDYLDL